MGLAGIPDFFQSLRLFWESLGAGGAPPPGNAPALYTHDLCTRFRGSYTSSGCWWAAQGCGSRFYSNLLRKRFGRRTVGQIKRPRECGWVPGSLALALTPKVSPGLCGALAGPAPRTPTHPPRFSVVAQVWVLKLLWLICFSIRCSIRSCISKFCDMSSEVRIGPALACRWPPVSSLVQVSPPAYVCARACAAVAPIPATLATITGTPPCSSGPGPSRGPVPSAALDSTGHFLGSAEIFTGPCRYALLQTSFLTFYFLNVFLSLTQTANSLKIKSPVSHFSLSPPFYLPAEAAKRSLGLRGRGEAGGPLREGGREEELMG